MRNRAGTPSPVSGPDRPLAQALAPGDVLEPDGLERLVRARTVESTAVLPASSRPPRGARGQFDTRHARSGWRQALPWACPGDAAGGHGELVFLAVDSAGRFVGAGRRNSACIAGTGIVPARGYPAWTGLQRRLPCAGRIQVVERGADPAAGKQPRHCSRHRGRDPELAASGRRSVHAPAMPASPASAIRFTP